ncbi:hypothetical protein P8C59_007510 [Phyllachora maydis]|uniref:Uncharacterized protein n=1 Tax=Phyllachora maydis TaxID=1825666 RepID=A0AAD9MDM2_9PEZI|nr:hypothetical protein P8C59_007510 [Phyllachora maydis]
MLSWPVLAALAAARGAPDVPTVRPPSSAWAGAVFAGLFGLGATGGAVALVIVHFDWKSWGPEVPAPVRPAKNGEAEKPDRKDRGREKGGRERTVELAAEGRPGRTTQWAAARERFRELLAPDTPPVLSPFRVYFSGAPSRSAAREWYP